MLAFQNISLVIKSSSTISMERYLDRKGVFARPDFMTEEDEYPVVSFIKALFNMDRADRMLTRKIVAAVLARGHRQARLGHLDVSDPTELAKKLAQQILMTGAYKSHLTETVEYINQVNISAGRKFYLPNICTAQVMREAAAPVRKEDLEPEELSFGGAPDYRPYRKCLDYNTSECRAAETGGFCGNDDFPLIHCCDRWDLQFICST